MENKYNFDENGVLVKATDDVEDTVENEAIEEDLVELVPEEETMSDNDTVEEVEPALENVVETEEPIKEEIPAVEDKEVVPFIEPKEEVKMDDNKEPEKIGKPNKKDKIFFTAFACVMTGVIVYLATSIGHTSSDGVETSNSNVESNIVSNSNFVSNLESNANGASNITSNVVSNTSATSNITSNVVSNTSATSNTTPVATSNTSATSNTTSKSKKLTISSFNGTGETATYEVDAYAKAFGTAGASANYYFVKDSNLYYVNSVEPSKKTLIASSVIDIIFNSSDGFIAIVDINKFTKPVVETERGISYVKYLKVSTAKTLKTTSMNDGTVKNYQVDSSANVYQGGAGITNNYYFVKDKALYYVHASNINNAIKIATGVRYVAFTDLSEYAPFVAVVDSDFKYVNKDAAYMLKTIETAKMD